MNCNKFPIVDCIFRFITCVKEELIDIQLIWVNYVPKHSQDQNIYHVWGQTVQNKRTTLYISTEDDLYENLTD